MTSNPTLAISVDDHCFRDEMSWISDLRADDVSGGATGGWANLRGTARSRDSFLAPLTLGRPPFKSDRTKQARTGQ